MKDPLQAIPVIAPGVEARADRRGCLQVRKERQYSGGFGGRVARFLRAPAYTQLQLDEKGTFFWHQINGERSLEEIGEVIRERYGVSRRESREAVTRFTAALMQRHLIQLTVPRTDVVRGSPDPAQQPDRGSPDPGGGSSRAYRRRGQKTGAEHS